MPPKLYEGTKRLTAHPMTRGDYNAYRGWECPADESPSDAGYLVEYQDGGKANDSRHAGYISWSPVDVFERSYKQVPGSELPPHQQRVLQEKAELDERREKLAAFYSTPIFHGLPESEQSRLLSQGVAMRSYSEILGARICAFHLSEQ